ncbi:hypothetical protein CROQUDRAFT_679167 [Cronartium quercuum f. sp. fusiforme G11]|uniref:RNase H type-1 domain-containing protein n=1 Tax=Cronartium quercuum f. sp. fusiforme G11 TaxID=708437 RepID=A0A9P6NAZ1_9BASI|nr:hypothetical protein CROQUDRAFT_679167 [Cronartium quercuum f. sp. fusiforme G11]
MCSMDLEVIIPHLTPPWLEPMGEILNLDLKRDEAREKIQKQIEEEKADGALVLFTDGSAIPGTGCRAAMVSDETIRSRALGPPDEISNFEAEIMGISLAMTEMLRMIEDNTQTYKGVSIFCDNQAAIRLVNNPPRYGSGQYLSIAIHELTMNFPHDFRTRFFWTPGHEGVELNEQADATVKEAAEEQEDVMTLKSSLGMTLRKIRSYFHIRKYNFNMGRPFLTAPSKRVADALSSLEKGHVAIIFQLRSDHNALNAYLHRFHLVDSSWCQTCRVPKTTTHFLMHCRQFMTQ